MKIYNKLISLIALGILLSCNISQPITGNYSKSHDIPWCDGGKTCRIAGEKFSINGDNSFQYMYRSDGKKEWSCGQWEEISKDRILLTSILHDSLPISVSEAKQNITNKEIIFSEECKNCNLAIELVVNGKYVINTTGSNRSVLLSDEDFPTIESICIRASTNEPIVFELANFTAIGTKTYNVKNTDSNTFYISFPYNKKLYEFFYLKEIQDTFVIHRKSLIYDDMIFKRTRR